MRVVVAVIETHDSHGMGKSRSEVGHSNIARTPNGAKECRSHSPVYPNHTFDTLLDENFSHVVQFMHKQELS